MNPIGRELRRRLRVAWGLASIERHERVDERTGRKLATQTRRGAAPRTDRQHLPLRKWDGISERSFAAYTREAPSARIARVLDLAPPGCRILDIGIGYGYVTGVVLRDLRPSYYCGVDLKDTFIEATREMIEVNGLDDDAVELEILDVFDIDERFARRHAPDVVLLLEVLEHVSDPAGALRAVAAAVRPATTILFTVPLRGRLDGVWGHASVFDRRRLQRICRESGLTIERAEPVHSTWALIAARTGDAPPSPAPRQRPGLSNRGSPEPGYTFSTVPVGGPPERYRRPSDGPNVEIKPTRARLRCLIRPLNGHPGGGVRLEMPSPRVARVELSIDPPGAVRRLRIEGLDEAENTRLEWAVDATGREIGERTTYVLRPGQPAHILRPSGAKDPEGVRWMDVSVEPQPDSKLTLTVHRAAYLGSGSE